MATCFSFSIIKEKLHLTINSQPIPQEKTATGLGVKLNKRLTWNPHIKEIEKRTTKCLSLIKKLDSQWQHPKTSLHRKCPLCNGIWSSSIGHSRFAKVQSNRMRTITCRLKSLAMETVYRLPSLDQYLEEKILIHSEKFRRLSAHPVSQHLQEPTKKHVEENQLPPSCQASCNISCLDFASHP